jgi:hypothetical protein
MTGGCVPIMDFGTFTDALTTKEEWPIRIALLGDSFTEGDIMSRNNCRPCEASHISRGPLYRGTGKQPLSMDFTSSRQEG